MRSSLTSLLAAVLLASCSASPPASEPAAPPPVSPPKPLPSAAPAAPDPAPTAAPRAASPAPAAIGSVDGVIEALLVDDASVYVGAGDVFALPKAGGAARKLTGADFPRSMGQPVTGGSLQFTRSAERLFVTRSEEVQQPSTPEAIVYWFVDSIVTIVPLHDGAPFVLPTRDVEVGGAAADAQWVYWLQSAPMSRVRPERLPLDRLMKMPAAGGAPRLVAHLGHALMFGIDATSAYVARLDKEGQGGHEGQGSLLRVPLAGGSPVVIAREQSWRDDFTTLTFDETHVYWTAGRRLVRADKGAAGPSAPGVVVENFDAVSLVPFSAYAVDATHVYWTSTSALMRAKKDGSAPPERLAAGDHLGAIAVDAAAVFYAAGSSVMRLPK